MDDRKPEKLELFIPRRRLAIIDSIIIALTVFVLVLLLYETTTNIPESTRTAIIWIDTAACIAFIAEFIYKIRHANSGSLYFKRHWIDLLSSIPFITFLRVGRALRLIRLFRFFRFIALFSRIGKHILVYFLEDTFTFILFSAITVCILGSVYIYYIEAGINPNINSIGDAFWWCFVTLTSVGYGDISPVTTMGRIGGTVIIMSGLGLFSSLTALIATRLIEYKNRKERKPGSPGGPGD